MRRRDFLALTAGGTAVALPGMAEAAKAKIYKSQKARFKVVQVAGGLAKPWGMAFLPTGELLVTEKDIGRLRVIKNGKLESTPVSGVAPDAAESGLQDVAADPSFASNRRIYLTFVGGSGSQETTHVARAVLNGRQLTGWTVIYRATSAGTLGHHGNRVLPDGNGNLFIALGDRDQPELAQRLDDPAGKICRIRDDGSVPADNPFVNVDGARPEIYSLGHRDPQGLAFRPGTTQLWQSEHGPTGGDEINLIKAGLNYGWPRATHGTNPDGSPIGEGALVPGLEPPVHHWDALSMKPPYSRAPSGIGFYDGSKFPGWKGNLFVACLRGMRLVRLELSTANKVVKQEELLIKQVDRLRHVKQGPDGFLYLLVDRNPGKVLRLVPA
jgi:glucose/arabinose dehydrogenase